MIFTLFGVAGAGALVVGRPLRTRHAVETGKE
jgi:hypothetical protein